MTRVRSTLYLVLTWTCLFWSGALVASVPDEQTLVIARNALLRLPRPFGETVIVRTFADERADVSPPAGMITLIIGDSQTSTVYMDVTRNCRAEFVRRQIRCDVALVDDLAEEFQLGNSSTTKSELLAIILAHEIGHLVLGHGRSAYHGQDDAISVLDYSQHRAELQADAFAVQLLDRTQDPVSGAYRLVEYLARSAQHRSLCPDVFPAPCPCPNAESGPGCSTLPVGPGLPSLVGVAVKVTLKGTHPVYVVRFIRMLHLSANSRVRAVYGGDALAELRKMVVRDEAGGLQNVDALFQSGAQERAALRDAGRAVRQQVARHAR